MWGAHAGCRQGTSGQAGEDSERCQGHHVGMRVTGEGSSLHVDLVQEHMKPISVLKVDDSDRVHDVPRVIKSPIQSRWYKPWHRNHPKTVDADRKVLEAATFGRSMTYMHTYMHIEAIRSYQLVFRQP